MRTTELKIGDEKKEALLVAGGTGFKIYSASGINGWVLVIGRKVIVIEEKSSDFKIVSRYVNLKYQSPAVHTEIKNDFDGLIALKSKGAQALSPEPEL